MKNFRKEFFQSFVETSPNTLSLLPKKTINKFLRDHTSMPFTQKEDGGGVGGGGGGGGSEVFQVLSDSIVFEQQIYRYLIKLRIKLINKGPSYTS